MADTLALIDVESIFNNVPFEQPVIRPPYNSGVMMGDISSLIDIQLSALTSTVIDRRYVVFDANMTVFNVEPLMGSTFANTVPIIRDPVGAGIMADVYIGGKSPLPGDTARLIEAVESPLMARFASDKTQGYIPLTVNFIDESLNIPTSWLWNFGDGTTSGLQNPAHTYSVPGYYSVSLTVINDESIDFTSSVNYIYTHGRKDTFIISY